MRYIKTFEAYGSGSSLDAVTTMLSFMAKLGSGMQQKLAQAKLDCIQEVTCTPLAELFDEETIEKIKRRVHPVVKECYANALHTAECLVEQNVEYCEGYIIFQGIPIEHAFNKIGDKYFDVTQELAIGHDPSEQTYAVIGSWDPETALMVMASGPYQCYGEVFDKEFIENNKENVR